MKILVINAGSSSLKYQLINMSDEKIIAKGICEKIGFEDSSVSYQSYKGVDKKFAYTIRDHTSAFNFVKDFLIDKEYGVINSLQEISAVGHRVAQGGSLFDKPAIIDENVIKGIESLIPLAPIHNNVNLLGINACIDVFGKDVPQVAVFDTSFHATIPEKAYIYPIPYRYFEEYKIRKYGFHGTSHYYVSRECAKLLNKNIEDTKIITCHMGNGSSIAAIDSGKSIDTSMGFTPNDGLIMGTRCGSIDSGIVTFIAEKENLGPNELNDIFNKQSGFLGVSGISQDAREITKQAKLGNKRAILAQDILKYQVSKVIAGYIAVLGGCDAIVFTAGIGENQPGYREDICNSLSFMGVKIDIELNKSITGGKQSEISAPNSSIKVFVIPTNEEIVIARQTQTLVREIIKE